MLNASNVTSMKSVNGFVFRLVLRAAAQYRKSAATPVDTASPVPGDYIFSYKNGNGFAINSVFTV